MHGHGWVTVAVAMPITATFVLTCGEATMRPDQTDASFCPADDRPLLHAAARPGVRTPKSAQPPRMMANLRSAMYVIASLMTVWVVIVST